MASFKGLMKDTVLYGLSTIVGRFINYLLVPLYTHYMPKETGALVGINGGAFADDTGYGSDIPIGGVIKDGEVLWGGDGIIADGIDGFLCESKQPEKLAELLKSIAAMSPDDLKKMSQKAIERSKELSNGKVAESYLKKIQEL